MENYTFKSVVNEIFNRWTCEKKRASNAVLINFDVDNLMCVKAINPYSGNIKFMAAFFPFGEKYSSLAFSYGTPECIETVHNAFVNICEDVLVEKFGLYCRCDIGVDYYIAKKGQQFMQLLNYRKGDIKSAIKPKNEISYKPKTADGNFSIFPKNEEDYDSWFDKFVLCKGDNTTYEGDEIIKAINLDDNDYDYVSIEHPFYESIRALAADIWSLLNPKIVKYTDNFSYVKPKDIYVGVDKFAIDYIAEHCDDYSMLVDAVQKAAERYNGYGPTAVKRMKIAETFKNNFNDLKLGLTVLECLDEDFIGKIRREVEDLLEYKEDIC